MIALESDKVVAGDCYLFPCFKYSREGVTHVKVIDGTGNEYRFSNANTGLDSQDEIIDFFKQANNSLCMNNNNNVGQNPKEEELIIKDDIHFDLGPTAGTDTLGGRTGQFYSLTDLKNIAVARGAKYTQDSSLFDVAHEVIEIEVDLKPMGGQGYNEGDENQFVTATTANAAYKNNGSWTDLDPSGGRNDGEESARTSVPTSVEQIFIENGSVSVLHLTFQK